MPPHRWQWLFESRVRPVSGEAYRTCRPEQDYIPWKGGTWTHAFETTHLSMHGWCAGMSVILWGSATGRQRSPRMAEDSISEESTEAGLFASEHIRGRRWSFPQGVSPYPWGGDPKLGRASSLATKFIRLHWLADVQIHPGCTGSSKFNTVWTQCCAKWAFCFLGVRGGQPLIISEF